MRHAGPNRGTETLRRAVGTSARAEPGTTVLTIMTTEANVAQAREAMRMGVSKPLTPWHPVVEGGAYRIGPDRRFPGGPDHHPIVCTSRRPFPTPKRLTRVSLSTPRNAA